MTGPLALDAESLYVELKNGVRSLLTPQSHLVGIISGGVWLAERLQHDLALAGDFGTITSSLHRDDFAQRGLAGTGQTKLPFEVEGAHLVLLDDVLHTGRTLRAVINELYDYGRPASVKLAVLVDRGGRELPVQADYAASRIVLPAQQSLRLTRDDGGRFNFSVKG